MKTSMQRTLVPLLKICIHLMAIKALDLPQLSRNQPIVLSFRRSMIQTCKYLHSNKQSSQKPRKLNQSTNFLFKFHDWFNFVGSAETNKLKLFRELLRKPFRRWSLIRDIFKHRIYISTFLLLTLLSLKWKDLRVTHGEAHTSPLLYKQFIHFFSCGS